MTTTVRRGRWCREHFEIRRRRASERSGVEPGAANVTITATQATNGTTTLTYRATVLKAGTIREITMAIPSGTTGPVTSVNETVSSVTRTVLRRRPSRTVNVAVGAHLAIPLYGLRLPAGGPWTLGLKSIGTAGQVISRTAPGRCSCPDTTSTTRSACAPPSARRSRPA